MDVVRVTPGSGEARSGKETVSGPLSPAEITLDVLAVGLAECDALLARGLLPELGVSGPYVPGHSGVVGLVKQVGGAVENVAVDTRVVGLLPLGCEGGVRERLRAEALWFVPLPAGLEATLAAAVLEPGVRALTALHYQMRAVRGEVILIMDAATGSAGDVALQLAAERELRVLAAVVSREEATVLEARFQHRVEVLVVPDATQLAPAVLARTNHLGVDCVYESVARPLDAVQRKARIACLGAHGRWCVGAELQLDPPESRLLLLRGALVCFAWTPAWTMHPLQRGRYQHVAAEIVRLASAGKLRVSNIDRFPMGKTANALESVAKADGSAVIVVRGAK